MLAGHIDAMPPGMTDAEQAMAIAQAGVVALALVIETAANPGGRRGSKVKRVWKAITPDSGASAVLFLTHGIAATTARLASYPGHHLSAHRQEAARTLLHQHFPWSETDEAEIRDAATQIDPDDVSGLEEARVDSCFESLQTGRSRGLWRS